MEEEYKRRAKEQQKLIASMPVKYPVAYVEGEYDPNCFLQMAKGKEQMPEGGERCFQCYEIRLRETAKMAAEGNYDYFTTTLTISPLKNAIKLNAIGERLGQEYHISHLPTSLSRHFLKYIIGSFILSVIFLALAVAVWLNKRAKEFDYGNLYIINLGLISLWFLIASSFFAYDYFKVLQYE